MARCTLDGGEESDLQLLLPPAGAPAMVYGDREAGTRTVPNVQVRLGAIQALERIAQDSDRDHIRGTEIPCAYLRENAPERAARGF